jgi:hypothetical protein
MAEAKKNVTSKEVAKKVNLETTDLSKLDQNEIGQLLENLEADDNNEITSEYLKIEIGEEVRVWFTEMTKIKKKGGKDGEMTDACRFITSDGIRVINADAVIVSTVSNLKKPTPLLIQCLGETKNSNGTYKNFKIIELK